MLVRFLFTVILVSWLSQRVKCCCPAAAIHIYIPYFLITALQQSSQTQAAVGYDFILCPSLSRSISYIFNLDQLKRSFSIQGGTFS